MTAPFTSDERAAMREMVDALAHDCDASDRDLKKWVLLPVKYVRAVLEYVPRLLDALDTAEAKVERQRERLRRREEQVRRLRAEVTRLHALVADLRASTSPAWDEDTVRAAAQRGFDVAAAKHASDRYTDEQRHWATISEDEREMVRTMITAALAVVLEHLPVSGESRATVQAEALRDAADWLADMDDGRDTGYNSAGRDIIARLRDRADRLKKRADRG